jgi:hypothetical protein
LPTQDFVEGPYAGSETDLDPIINVDGDFSYSLTRYFSVGLNFEWELHGVSVLDNVVGTMSAYSLLPFVRVHFPLSKRFAPYVFFGGGYAINSFDPSRKLKDEATSLGIGYGVEMDNTYVLKAGAGVDAFLTDCLALNAELGWRYNEAEGREFLNGVRVSSGDFNASVIAILVGFHYYLPGHASGKGI